MERYLEDPYIDADLVFDTINQAVQVMKALEIWPAVEDPAFCSACEALFMPIRSSLGRKIFRTAYLYGLYYPCIWIGVGGGEDAVCWNTVSYHTDLVAGSLYDGLLRP